MASAELVKQILGRQSALESSRHVWEQEWQDVADYVIPIREDIKGTRQSGERQGKKIYDGTAVSAAVLATDGIHGYHVSPAFTWFMYTMNRKQLDKIHEIREWLQDGVEYAMYSALNRSNFYDEMWSFIYDGLTIGTAPLYMEEDMTEGRLVFENAHISECYIAENKYGEVDIFHRKRKLTARKAMQKFGAENLPPAIAQAYKTAPFSEFEFLHAVFPREDFDERKRGAKFKRYASIWLQGQHVCLESGYDNFPYAVWRYAKSGKEVYGRSPATMALAKIKGANLKEKALIGAAQLHIDPPLNVPSELMGKVQWKPRGRNAFDDPARVPTIMETGRGAFPIGIDMLERDDRVIKEFFHVDFFLMLAQLEGRGQRTAFEVSKLQEEKAAVLGAELAPLNKQLDGILDFVYYAELNAGRIPPPPDILLELVGESFEPVYMGPLAQAQRRLFGTQGIRSGLEALTPIAQLKPEILDRVDWDATATLILESSGFPQSAINTDDKVKALRDARTQAMAMENQKEDALAMAEGVKKVASADKDMDGGIREMIGNAVGGGDGA